MELQHRALLAATAAQEAVGAAPPAAARRSRAGGCQWSEAEQVAIFLQCAQ